MNDQAHDEMGDLEEEEDDYDADDFE